MTGEYRPAGVSIGRFLRFDRQAIMNADFVAAVAAIDRVHGVGKALPDIPLINAGTTADRERQRADAWLGFRVLDDGEVTPALVGVQIVVAQRRLKTLHEIGHFIDAVGLPGLGYSSDGAPELADWRAAVVNSRAYQELRGFRHLPRSPAAERVRVALRLDESWARSYAQFIAVRSGDQGLRNEVEALRLAKAGGVYYPWQWTVDDFARIDAAIVALFQRLGWMT